MNSLCVAVLLAASLLTGALVAAEEGMVAEWKLNEGQGDVIKDGAGHENKGRITGATWIECGTGHALWFEHADTYVDCGHGASLDLTGPVTIEAWVYPAVRPSSETGIAGKSFDAYGLTIYGDGNFYWYIGSGANKCHTAANITYWNHVAGAFDGETLKIYLNGALKDSCPSQFKTFGSGGDFYIGRIARSLNGPPGDTFKGAIGAVRVYKRALSEEEVRAHYEAEKGMYRRLEQGLNRIALRPYCYPEQNAIFADVDFGNYYPFAPNQRAVLSLWPKDAAKPLQEWPIEAIPDNGAVRDFKAETPGLAEGAYTLKARLLGDAGVVAEATAAFSYPQRVEVPYSAQTIVPALPQTPPLPSYNLKIQDAGGFEIVLSGGTPRSVAVESTYSYPHGGENVFAAQADRPAGEEAAWRVETARAGHSEYRVKGVGAHYTIERRLTRQPHRVLVQDTIRNTSSEPVGIVLSNHFRHAPYGDDTKVTHWPNPTVFVSRPSLGVGMVALDDVYLVQYDNFAEAEKEGLRDDKFALDAGAAYTLEWAVYLNGTGDYFDFINAIRRDEGLIRTVDGNFAFMDRREPPTEDFVKFRGLKYLSIACLSHAADDAGISIEGIEFMEYPKECDLVKKTFAETRRRFPEVKVMFHVAHSLYATNKPDALFPDSRTIDASGKQTDYGGNNIPYYLSYFSKEHVDEGYRWFIFYPAKDNAFGPAMLKATDYMLEELGATGIFADGLAHGYGGLFTYDRWDGHTAEIDPNSKTITRKCGSVNLLGQELLIEMVRKFNVRGAVVIANSYPAARTLDRENIIYCVETGGGDASLAHLHLAPTVIALGDPGRIHSERDVYDDTLAKLKWGALYFFYSEGTLTHRTLASEMFPITVEEIHDGVVKGKERIVTFRSGVYGWRDDHSLHFIHHFDGRGTQTPHDFVSTVDALGVRTHVTLAEQESAVIRKIPLTLKPAQPVNLLVRRYEPGCIEVLANGACDAELTVGHGDFPIQNGAKYVVHTNDAVSEATVQNDALVAGVSIHGPTSIRVEPVP